jgi:hypothetical protein
MSLQNVDAMMSDCDTSSNGLDGCAATGGRYHQWQWTSSRNGQSGMRFQNAECVLSQCDASSNGVDGLLVLSGTLTLSSSRCSGNTGNGLTATGVLCDGTDVTLSNNGANGMAGSGGGYDLKLFKLRDNAQHGASLLSTECRMLECVASSNALDGLSVDSSTITLSSSSVSSNARHGYVASSTVTDARDCTFDDNAVDGAQTLGGRYHQWRSSSSSNGRYGAQCHSTECRLQESVVSSNGGGGGGGGLLVVSGSLELHGSSVTSNTGIGLTASLVRFGSINDDDISDNSLSGAVFDDGGTGVACGPVRVMGSTLDNNGGAGFISVSSSSLDIDSSSFVGNADSGMSAATGKSTQVTRSNISNNRAHGATITGDATITEVDIQDNDLYGVSASGSLTVSGGTCLRNGGGGGGGGGGGLTVTGDLTISAMRVLNNTGDGVKFVPSTGGVYAFELVVTDNTGFGVTVTGGGAGVPCVGPATISRCVVDRNGSTGIDLQCAAGGEVSHCTVSSNGGDGIVLGPTAAHMRVSDNTCSSNINGLVCLSTGNLVVRNSCSSSSVSNYTVIVPGNAMGPVVDELTIAADCNPHSNYAH